MNFRNVTNLWILRSILHKKKNENETFKQDEAIATVSCANCCKLGVTNKEKVHFTLEQAMKIQRGSRGIGLLFL
jgi:hypothetical protein